MPLTPVTVPALIMMGSGTSSALPEGLVKKWLLAGRGFTFATMSGSGFRSPKMSQRTVRECCHDNCTTLGCSTFSPGVMCGEAITKQKVLLLSHSLVIS